MIDEEPDLVYEPFDRHVKKCGCYIVSQELAKLKPGHSILAPLKLSDYHLEIVNAIANVNLAQHYSNPTDKFLEMEYSFPIAPNACVYRFTAQFGKTRIEGVVKEKEQAKQEYKQAVSSGKKAAYGELDADSKDILNLKVGNVPPKETVVIEISYLQELSLAVNSFYQLTMAGTISPRYMNHIPGEKLKAGLRNEGAKVKGDLYWDFRISLRTARKVVFFDSHTHDIDLVSQNDPCTETELALGKSCLLNKDFVFSYTTEDFQLPSSVFGRTDAGSTAMISFIPKFCELSVDDAYKASVVGKSFETDIENGKGQYVFLLDRSGSMGGTRIKKAKEALILFIKSLPQDTYFNVISFGSSSEKLFPQSMRYSDKQVESAVNRVKSMGADLGGTEIYNPLSSLINSKLIEGYPKQIFLLTDGGVSNTEGVIRMVGQNNRFSRVHTIGIGNGCSQQLILGCAEKGKGHHIFITDSEDPSDKIIQLLTDSLSPVISKIKLGYDKDIVQSIIPNPESLPYILRDELVNFYITFKGQLQKQAVFDFSYQDNKNKKPYKSDIVVDPSVEGHSFVDRMGHFKRIRLLEDSHKSNSSLEDLMYYVKKVDKKAEIIIESVKHQILSEFTAFLCVEKELVDGKYEEVKDKGTLKVQIENPDPSEMKNQDFYQMAPSRSSHLAFLPPPPPPPPPQFCGGGLPPRLQQSPMLMSSKPLKPHHSSSSQSFMPLSSTSQLSSPSQQQKIPAPPPPPGASLHPPPPPPQFASLPPPPPPQLASLPSLPSQNTPSLPLPIIQDSAMQLRKMSSQKQQEEINYMLDEDFDDMELEQSMNLFEKKMEEKQQQALFEKQAPTLPHKLVDFSDKNTSKRAKKQKNKDFQKSEKKQELKKDPPKKINANISDIISLQATEGSWKDVHLIELLYNSELQNKVKDFAQAALKIVVTYLVAKWIEKNYPQKQYSLVVKKGINFANKNSQNFEKLVQDFSQYLQ